MSEHVVETVTHEFPDPRTAENVTYDPSLDDLRAFSEHLETTTEYGSPSYVSEFRSRSADRTKNSVDHEFTEADRERLSEAQERAHETELVCLDRMVGRHPETAFCCRLYVPKEYGRIALAWAKLLEPAPEGREPDFQTLQLPDHDDTRIRVDVDAGVTYVLGSDYTGEAKKSFLRLFMYRTKQQGGLGIHAGSKRVRVADESGDLQTVGQAFLGLSATGKSTLTCHGCWLDGPEGAEMLQDDVCAFLPDGTVAGSEGGGLYIKTIGLDADEQPGLHHAATRERAVLENVAVDEDGTVDFDDDTLTSNGRAVVRRDDLPSADEEIDLPDVDQVFFITRNPVMPPVARLTPEQAAVAFMLGESIQTSAGDPDEAGEAIRVVGTNPFIVGSEGEEGNRFHDLVAANDVDCFVINTGHLGSEAKDVGVEESVTILCEVARNSIDWRHDDALGLEIPEHVPGMDIEAFYPPDYVEDYRGELAAVRAERQEYLRQFEDLREEIRDAAY
ncbi:phosphoenolpyruvate carboxykinase (ATP) [Halobacterium wangiae]|uniref:phosphoenolpyruvate carboxykinase (ATP) n=1 Tax=Halobacterium wangiae TaxID=2902623 RepID=UPI001E6479AC|nr:phosphoenolpyruvate carboxykinase (ATP) [Halobacterium wangiae]